MTKKKPIKKTYNRKPYVPISDQEASLSIKLPMELHLKLRAYHYSLKLKDKKVSQSQAVADLLRIGLNRVEANRKVCEERFAHPQKNKDNE